MSNRITDIKNNLERLEDDLRSYISNKKLIEVNLEKATTLTENIKEADAMILFLERLRLNIQERTLRFDDWTKIHQEIHLAIKDELKDWQNLKAFLQNSLDSPCSSKTELEGMK